MNLLEGYKVFRSEHLKNYQPQLKEFEHGQSPHTLFITCSDSRIDPHLITNSKPGELFVVRNAGNFIASRQGASKEESVLSTLEYALNILKIKNIVICGHTDCGAVKAVKADLSGTTYLKSYIPNFKSSDPKDVDFSIEQNVRAQIRSILENELFSDLDLSIHGWVYNVSTGGMKVLDEKGQNFQSI